MFFLDTCIICFSPALNTCDAFSKCKLVQEIIPSGPKYECGVGRMHAATWPSYIEGALHMLFTPLGLRLHFDSSEL